MPQQKMNGFCFYQSIGKLNVQMCTSNRFPFDENGERQTKVAKDFQLEKERVLCEEFLRVSEKPVTDLSAVVFSHSFCHSNCH